MPNKKVVIAGERQKAQPSKSEPVQMTITDALAVIHASIAANLELLTSILEELAKPKGNA